jgi:hypothetical protein
MRRTHRLNRRSFLARVAGGAVAGAFATASGTPAFAQITDRDPTDPAGRGRGGGSGITDRDPTDPAGRGRGGGSGITDSDTGQGSDPAGRGRGAAGGGAGRRRDDRDSDACQAAMAERDAAQGELNRFTSPRDVDAIQRDLDIVRGLEAEWNALYAEQLNRIGDANWAAAADRRRDEIRGVLDEIARRNGFTGQYYTGLGADLERVIRVSGEQEGLRAAAEARLRAAFQRVGDNC